MQAQGLPVSVPWLLSNVLNSVKKLLPTPLSAATPQTPAAPKTTVPTAAGRAVAQPAPCQSGPSPADARCPHACLLTALQSSQIPLCMIWHLGRVLGRDMPGISTCPSFCHCLSNKPAKANAGRYFFGACKAKANSPQCEVRLPVLNLR